MPMPKDDDENDVYRVETVPPPPGEADAYSAPTKIGAMPAAVLDDMKKAALSGAPLKPTALPNQGPKPAALEISESSGVITRIRHEEDDEPASAGDATRVVPTTTGAVAQTPPNVEEATRSERSVAPTANPALSPPTAAPLAATAANSLDEGRWWPLLVLALVLIALSVLFANQFYVER